MATQHQVIDIRLPSGLILRDAVGLLCVKFGQWPWGRFDGISPADPNTIMDADVDISFSGARARSNVPRALYKARIQEKRDELTAFLRAIPADVGLEDEGLELTARLAPDYHEFVHLEFRRAR